MSVQSEIDRIITAVGNAYRKVSEKGGTVPASQTIANLATAIDSIPSGGAKETWVIKDNAPVDENSYKLAKTNISFASYGAKFVALEVYTDEVVIWLKYYTTANQAIEVGSCDLGMGEDRFYWQNNAYKKLTFDTPPTGDLLTWLQSNAVKQPDDTAVQDTKALTITSNGTVSVTPDAPYDALKKVDVTVNVASGGGGGAGFKVTFPATAANWNNVDPNSAYILLKDGTIKSVKDYSTIGGKTIENVAGILIHSTNYFYVLRMTLSAGEIAQFQFGAGTSSYVVTTAPNATATPYSAGGSIFWWPLADTVISAIEMYNTD